MAKEAEAIDEENSSDSHKEDDEGGYEEADMYMPGFNSNTKKTTLVDERPRSPSFKASPF